MTPSTAPAPPQPGQRKQVIFGLVAAIVVAVLLPFSGVSVYFVTEIVHKNEEIAQLNEDIAGYKSEILNLQEHVTILKVKIEHKEDELQKLHSKVAGMESSMEALNEKLEFLKNENSSLEAKLKEAEIQMDKQTTRVQELDMELRRLKGQIAGNKRQINDLLDDKAKLAQLLGESEYTAQQLQQDQERMGSENQALNDKLKESRVGLGEVHYEAVLNEALKAECGEYLLNFENKRTDCDKRVRKKLSSSRNEIIECVVTNQAIPDYVESMPSRAPGEVVELDKGYVLLCDPTLPQRSDVMGG